MRASKKVCFSLVLLIGASAFAETVQSKHFIIESPLDSRYINFIQANVEAYYENMAGHYFDRGWGAKRPLKIYYLVNESDTQELLKKHGIDFEGYGKYVASEQAVYTHQYLNNGVATGWGTVFHEITHHFVAQNYKNVPSWFNEGLATFFAEQTRIVKGKLTLGRPNPWRERELRNMIENGLQIDVKFLTSTTIAQFYSWKPAYHVDRALFYWLYETGRFDAYLRNAQLKGCSLSVLKETVGKSEIEINQEILSFIKANCYPAAYFEDGRIAGNLEQKTKLFEKALQIKPDYQPAILELARCSYNNNEYEKSRAALKPILDDLQSIQHRESLCIISDSFYHEKNYAAALEYYQKAWEYSDYDEYKYVLAYWIANCHHNLNNYEMAKQWYQQFLDLNWEPTRHADWVSQAKSYEQNKTKS